jgi:hypothetical protein
MKKRTINLLYASVLLGLILLVTPGCDFLDGLVGDEQDGSESAVTISNSTNATVNVGNTVQPTPTPAPTPLPVAGASIGWLLLLIPLALTGCVNSPTSYSANLTLYNRGGSTSSPAMTSGGSSTGALERVHIDSQGGGALTADIPVTVPGVLP